MEDSIFTKIIKGEIPAYTIYEDERTIAFLDIEPTRIGHTLVVPKVQIDQFIDLDEENYNALWATVGKVARHLREILGVKRVAVKIIGVDVPHAHVHLIPFNSNENHYHDDTSPNLSAEEFRALTEKLRM